MVLTTDFQNQYSYTGLDDYEVSFEYDVTASLVVTWINTDDVESAAKVEGLDYSIVTVGAVAYCRVLIDLGSGGTIRIYRNVANTQTWKGVDGTTPQPSAIMRAMDRIVWQIQKVAGSIFNVLKAPLTEQTDMTIPNAAARRGGFAIYEDTAEAKPSVAAGVTSLPVSAFMEPALLALTASAFYDDVSIDELTAATSANDTDVFHLKTAAGNDRKITSSNLFGGLSGWLSSLVAHTWSIGSVNAGAYVSGVCYSESLKIFSATTTASTNNHWVSTDGILWDMYTGGANGVLANVIWVEALGLFVSVGGGSTDNVQYSANGTSWTSVSTATNGALINICWSEADQLLVAVGSVGTNNVKTSPDAINWTDVTLGSIQFYGVHYSEEQDIYVTVNNQNTNNIWWCEDSPSIAGNWTSVTTLDGDLKSVSYSPLLDLWVAVGDKITNNIQPSPDGKTWTEATGLDGEYNTIVWSDELALFMVIGFNATDNTMYSKDGFSWSVFTTTPLGDLCYSKEVGRFVGVSQAAVNVAFSVSKK